MEISPVDSQFRIVFAGGERFVHFHLGLSDFPETSAVLRPGESFAGSRLSADQKKSAICLKSLVNRREFSDPITDPWKDKDENAQGNGGPSLEVLFR
jgi:hypothetical protein